MAAWDEQTEARTLRNDIQNIIDALNTHHRNVNISRVTGSSVAVATGVPAAACAVVAVFTAGLTLIPAVVLGIIAAVGGGVSVGATVTEYFIKRQKVKEVQERWETFRQRFISDHRDIAMVRDALLSLNARSGAGTIAVRRNAQDAFGAFQRLGGIGNVLFLRGIRVGAAGVRIAAPLLAAAGVVALPLDIVDLVTAGLALHEGEQSTATESLRHIVTFLDNVINGGSNNDNNGDDTELLLGNNSDEDTFDSF